MEWNGEMEWWNSGMVELLCGIKNRTSVDTQPSWIIKERQGDCDLTDRQIRQQCCLGYSHHE